MDPDDDIPIHDHGRPMHHHHGPFWEAREAISEAAIEAEMLTGDHEETVEQARRGVLLRTLRALVGFVLIGIGVALLPLPGPGWVVIIVGLSMLPFTWAERTIALIRRKIPGVPDEGRIPLSTWLIMGFTVLVASLMAVHFGARIGDRLGDTWSSLWN